MEWNFILFHGLKGQGEGRDVNGLECYGVEGQRIEENEIELKGMVEKGIK